MAEQFVAFVIGVEQSAVARAVLTALQPSVDRIVQLRSLADFRRGPRRALVIQFGDVRQLSDATAFASRNCEAAYLAFVADDIPSVALRELLATGGGEWLPSAAADAEIAALAERLAGTTFERARVAPRSTLVSFVPAGGGVGNTTLAVEVALACARRRPAGREPTTCLLDFGGQLANACDLLDLRPHLDLAGIAADPQRLDATMLESFRSRSPHGVDVYAPPKFAAAPGPALLPALRVLLDLLARLYGRIHADLGPDLGPAAEHVLRRSDVVLFTAEFSVASARRLAALKSHLGALATERQAVLVNRHPGGRLRAGLTRSDFEQATTCLRFLDVADAGAFARECANIGAPMLAENPRHKVCRDIGAIEDFIAPRASARPGPSRLRRLFGGVGLARAGSIAR
jgi:pilus assembly protein CpaE